MTQETALKILKMGANVFLTGEPGSGKTHTINEYINYLKKHSVEPAVTASTGIAATHIGGTTIHSWSGIGIKQIVNEYDLDSISSKKYVCDRVRNAKVLIIDEISMLGKDIFESVDKVLKEIKQNGKPFGGLQVVLVGDFFQLPPISKETETDFVFNSSLWQELELIPCYLEEQHRQDDEVFLQILKGIRRQKILKSHLDELTKRLVSEEMEVPRTRLFTHNADVEYMNNEEIKKISAKEKIFEMTEKGREMFIMGLKKGCLSPSSLVLKEGALVMFTKNNIEKGYQNGTLGEVSAFEKESGFPIIKTYSGETIVAEPIDWSFEEDGKVRATITQVPLRLAWAITVHKSQGMTFDSAFMDLSNVFEYGQGYVALSRVKSLSGLFLGGINKRVFNIHPEVFEKDKIFQEESEKAEEEIKKIGSEELKKVHNNFIIFSGGSIEEQEKKQKIKERTELQTLDLLTKEKDIEKVAKKRELKPETIVSHIEKLIELKKITEKEVREFIPKSLLKNEEKIKKEFIKKSGALKPVFESFAGKFSYYELRLIRLLFLMIDGPKESVEEVVEIF